MFVIICLSLFFFAAPEQVQVSGVCLVVLCCVVCVFTSLLVSQCLYRLLYNEYKYWRMVVW